MKTMMSYHLKNLSNVLAAKIGEISIPQETCMEEHMNNVK